MNNQGSVILRGRVGSDLRSMTTQSGTKGIRFRLAASQWRINDSGKYEERDPHWYTVCVWDRALKKELQSLSAGDQVLARGLDPIPRRARSLSLTRVFAVLTLLSTLRQS